jgi:hypothetical protein
MSFFVFFTKTENRKEKQVLYGRSVPVGEERIQGKGVRE